MTLKCISLGTCAMNSKNSDSMHHETRNLSCEEGRKKKKRVYFCLFFSSLLLSLTIKPIGVEGVSRKKVSF